jgi:hypothetical protein
VRYEDIILVDSDGDGYRKHPHIYVEFSRDTGPYSGVREFLSIGGQRFDLDEEWTRIDFFSKTLSNAIAKPRVHITRKIELDTQTLKGFLEYKSDADTLYAIDDRYDFLQQRDIVPVAGTSQGGEHFLKVMYIQKSPFGAFLKNHPEAYKAKRFANQQIGREVGEVEEVTIVEVSRTHPHEWEGS